MLIHFQYFCVSSYYVYHVNYFHFYCFHTVVHCLLFIRSLARSLTYCIFIFINAVNFFLRLLKKKLNCIFQHILAHTHAFAFEFFSVFIAILLRLAVFAFTKKKIKTKRKNINAINLFILYKNNFYVRYTGNIFKGHDACYYQMTLKN